MKKIMTFIAALMLAAPALAQTATEAAPVKEQQVIDCNAINGNKLGNEQYAAAVKQLCATQANAIAETVTPEDVREWASLGKEFSVAVTDTAKGLGVAVNDFLVTPVGLLLAFYFMWDMIGGILVGIPLIFFIWWCFFRGLRAMHIASGGIEYDYKPVFWGLWNRRVIKKFEKDYSNENVGIYIFIAGVGCSLATMLTLGVLVF